ncbi:NAD(P)H:quinone oxidoreductase [uncultured Nocardioides sp.]|uniref:NAD(P)H:quinone oxidoreductase n=1 Tax=uncultured Nocardioides sp. TaxID=198441 RepID=UPI002639FA3F|nr:NAD(P)H:quinone oxidoreductase [uncultured Nocardioides sp.]
MTKVAIVYYSSYGTGQAMAERLEQTAQGLGAEVRRRHVAETVPDEIIAGQEGWKAHRDAVADEPTASPDDLEWADVVIFGSGTRYGSVTSQLQSFIDTLGPLWGQGKLADKVYAGFTSTSTLHGGQETTLLALMTTFTHFGGIIVPPGYTDPVKFEDGNPYGVGIVAGENVPTDVDNRALDHLITRAITVSQKLGA